MIYWLIIGSLTQYRQYTWSTLSYPEQITTKKQHSLCSSTLSFPLSKPLMPANFTFDFSAWCLVMKWTYIIWINYANCWTSPWWDPHWQSSSYSSIQKLLPCRLQLHPKVILLLAVDGFQVCSSSSELGCCSAFFGHQRLPSKTSSVPLFPKQQQVIDYYQNHCNGELLTSLIFINPPPPLSLSLSHTSITFFSSFSTLANVKVMFASVAEENHL